MIVVLDYGLGNNGSVVNMLKRLGADVVLASKEADLRKADRIIIPGVGAFDHGMRKLQEAGVREVLDDCVLNRKTPVLGICLGMQLMTRSSEEGELPGLGWIDAVTRRFDVDEREENPLPVPHMGWNAVRAVRYEDLFLEVDLESRFYFVHSYHVCCNNDSDVLVEATYGNAFTAGFQSGNIMGVQFHPEKSHCFGIHFFQSWLKMDWDKSC